jgi:hypothetical protein
MKDSGDRIIDRVLPRQIDNSYRGHKVAPWLFALVVLMKTSIGLGTIFNGRNAATSADGIALDTFTTAGAQAFLAMFAAWGLAQATIGVMCIVVLAVGLFLSLRWQRQPSSAL